MNMCRMVLISDYFYIQLVLVKNIREFVWLQGENAMSCNKHIESKIELLHYL